MLERQNGPKISAHIGAQKFLQNDGEKTLGEIRKFLLDCGTKYTKQGIILLLKNLIDSGRVGKHRKQGTYYPTYFLTKKEYNDIGLRSSLFAINARYSLMNQFINSDISEPNYIEKMINKIGLYAVYCYFLRWYLVSKNSKEDYAVRFNWIDETLKMPHLMRVLDTLLYNFKPNMSSKYKQKQATHLNTEEKPHKALDELKTIIEKMDMIETSNLRKMFKESAIETRLIKQEKKILGEHEKIIKTYQKNKK